jgi:aminoglycoside phosphotransferase (APT) family kinase protein
VIPSRPATPEPPLAADHPPASPQRPPTGDELARVLTEALAEHGVSDAGVAELRRLSGGASRETFAFELGSARRGCILQRTRAGSVGSLPMSAEADLLGAARSAGVPVPGVLASGSGDDPAPAGGWMVVDRVEGETIARRILRDDTHGPARHRLVADCGRALAAVHRIDLDAVPELPGGDPLSQLRLLVDAMGEPHPALELGFRWLEAHRPAPAGLSVVHGDFRLGNLVVGPDGLRAVLDWELAHRGDPLEDLAWLCVRAWRFGHPAPVGGLGTREELFAAYESAGGRPVDPEAVAWWEALGCLRWGAICLLQSHAHLSGASRSVELAAIGRRTCEAEHDLFLALAGLIGLAVPAPPTTPTGPGPAQDTPPVDAARPPHDRPSAPELLDAVGEFLTERVVEATDGRDRFHARVAANVVAMVAREVRSGDEQRAAHTRRLAALGVADDGQLAAAIAAGAFDDRLDELFEALWWSVDAKLAVANPGYRIAGE